MITDILLLAGALLAIVAVVIFLFALMRVPEGTEDKTGFHNLNNGSPVSRPPFATKSRRLVAEKKKVRPGSTFRRPEPKGCQLAWPVAREE